MKKRVGIERIKIEISRKNNIEMKQMSSKYIKLS